MLLNSHISAYATCFARKACGLVRSAWGTCLGGDKLGARDGMLNTKVARRACAGRALGKHFTSTPAPNFFCVAGSMHDAMTGGGSQNILYWGQGGTV